MRLFKRILNKIFKKKSVNEPWLEYYSKEDKSIKFTNKNIYEYMRDNIGSDLDYTAINYFNRHISFGEFLEKIEAASRSLRSLGVKPKDIVTICMPNTPEAVIMFYAVNNVGAIADMIHPLSAPNQIKQYLLESQSRLLLLIDVAYDKMKDLIPETFVYKTIVVSAKESMPPLLTVGYDLTRGWKIKKPKLRDKDYMTWKEFMNSGHGYRKPFESPMKSKDTAIILHSGGTTGVPKGIMVSNYNFNALAQQGGVNVAATRPKDKALTILPIFHGFGLGVFIHTPLCLKVEVNLVPEFDAKRFYKIMRDYKPNIVGGVPTLWSAMLENKNFDDVDMSQLKYVISGGDYLTLAMEEKMNNFLRTHGASISMTKGYGMTESVAATAYTLEGANEPGSVGIPMIGNSYCICKPDTEEELPIGEEGEICVYGPTVMQGYFKKPEETAKVLRTHKDGKKWLHTGDMGYITASGIVFFTQRLKRMIVSSGFNVYPSVIEEVIEMHPDVAKSCVIGIPHQYKVHVAKAFIVLKDNKKDKNKVLKEIKEICKKNLEVYAQPREYEFREELPKTLYSKVDYKKLEKEEEEKINK